MIAEAWLFALGLCGALLFVAGVLHVPITPFTGAAAALIAIAASVRRRKPDGEQLAISRGAVRSRRGATVVTLIPLAIVIYAATFVPLRDFDGRAFWLLKAKGIAHDRAIDGPFFHDQLVTDPRNDYPLLLPLDASVVLLVGHTYDDTVVRWLYVITFIAFVFLVRHRLGPWPAALLAWIPQFSVVNDGGALSAYNDIPLAAFLAAAFFALADDGPPWRFGMWLAFAALTKNEGLPLALILLAAGAFAWRRRVLPALLPFGFALAALFAWKQRIPHGNEEDLGTLLLTLPHQLHRLPAAVAGFARHLISPTWGLFWCAVAVGLIAAVVAPPTSAAFPSPTRVHGSAAGVGGATTVRRNLLLAAFVVGGAFALYVAVYTVTSWVQLDLIDSSADRVLMHVVGPGLYVFAMFFSVRQEGSDRG